METSEPENDSGRVPTMKTACPYHTAEVHELTGRVGFLTEIRRRARVFDLVPIVSVPVVLLVLHGLPLAARRELAFEFARPTLVTAYTSNFVHLDWPHLAGNLVAYSLIVPAAYLVSVLSNRRRHFLVVFFLVIGVIPFVVSLTQPLFLTEGTEMGFSGIVMAFYGYASLVFVGYLATRLTTAIHLDHAPLVFFTQTTAIAAITVPQTVLSVSAIGVSLLLAAVYLASLVRSLARSSTPVFGPDAKRSGFAETGVFVAGIIAAFLFVGFSGARASGTTVNLFAHFVGFASGFSVSYVALRTDCSLRHVYHCAGPDTDCQLHDSPLTRLLRRLLVARLF